MKRILSHLELSIGGLDHHQGEVAEMLEQVQLGELQAGLVAGVCCGSEIIFFRIRIQSNFLLRGQKQTFKTKLQTKVLIL